MRTGGNLRIKVPSPLWGGLGRGAPSPNPSHEGRGIDPVDLPIVRPKGDKSTNNKPIGVFDSGLGGLTVMKELIRQLPLEDIVYYGDTARVPYGTKSRESIIRFSIENTEVLLSHKVKMVVVACNSCSSYALKALKKKFRIPIIGVIRPGVKRAVEVSRSGRIGVAATQATVASGEYVKMVRRFSKDMKVFARACPLFVPLAEEGWFHKSAALTIAEEYMRPLKQAHIDTLILGCTHYPLLKDIIQKAVGPDVALVDSAQEVAGEVKTLLTASGNRKLRGKAGRHKFLVSDRPQGFREIARRFLGRDIRVVSQRS